MFKLVRPLCGTLALITLATAAAGAQATPQTATIDALATVSQQLSNLKGKDLDFGIVYPGIDKTVAVTDGAAGYFQISGGAGAQISYSFALPGTLDQVGGSGTMSLADWSACHSLTAAASGCASNYTPSSSEVVVNLSSTGGLYVFIGARLVSAAGQPQGDYRGTISMTAKYTGL